MLIALLASDVIGQQNPALMEVVNAEKSFADYAKAVGISEAFMKFLDDSAVVFEGGEILNGRKVWAGRNAEGAELLWYPEFAEVSASGDLGYTTGPSQFRVKKGSAAPDYRGYFSSIWRKNGNGEWKVMLDVGCASPSEYNESKVEYESVKKGKRVKAGKTNIKALEESFIANYAGGNGYSKFGSSTARYYRPNQPAIKGKFMSPDTAAISFKNAGTGMASSGDLGYAYGYISGEGRKGNYFRVWKHEDDGWKIVLDVLNY